LSVPTVRVPGVLVGRSAAAQDAAWLAEADAAVEADALSLPWPAGA
jgi:hypothetical protein